LAANFSPIPRIAPPPLGSEIDGDESLGDVICAEDTPLFGFSAVENGE
jgi:hypothetical protein